MYQEDFHLSHYQQFPPKLQPQHMETDKVYDFLQSAKLTFVDDYTTQLEIHEREEKRKKAILL